MRRDPRSGHHASAPARDLAARRLKP
jgi:hypothetical protein